MYLKDTDIDDIIEEPIGLDIGQKNYKKEFN